MSISTNFEDFKRINYEYQVLVKIEVFFKSGENLFLLKGCKVICKTTLLKGIANYLERKKAKLRSNISNT